VFYFRAGAEEDVYLSSADWMSRNMLRRIELAWPVTDARLRQRIFDECLVAYQADTQDAWNLGADGRYTCVRNAEDASPHSAQAALMALYGPTSSAT
jgi:polyphosphate kinase